jgi:soluble lytic murein transglycosylase
MNYPFFKFYKSDIWVSELLARLFLFSFGMIIVSIMLTIILNIFQINNNAQNRLAGQKENHVLSDELSHLEKLVTICEGIEALRGTKFDPAIVSILGEIIAENSARFGYDPLLLLAVINVESSFESNALGKFKDGSLSGALGLMQLKFETAKEIGDKIGISLSSPEELFLPEKNIPIGIYYLTSVIVQFNSLSNGILAYNIGPTNLRKGLRGEIPFSKEYYNRVMRSYYRLKRETKI